MTAGHFSKLLVVAAAVVLLGASASVAPAAPMSFQLVFYGHHVVADFPSPTGLSHEGPFTTNYPACPSGYGKNTAETDQGVATRLFMCDGSTATFTALVWPQLAEHGGTGFWQIISGTGSLTDLRGKGTFSSVLTSGDPNDFITIDFTSTWAGSIDLDAVPPTLAVTKERIVKAKRPAHAYKLSLALALTDNGGGPVTYRLTLVDPRTLNILASKSGSSSEGSISRKFVLRPSRKTRSLRLRLDATDAVGNQATLRKTIRLRR
jgi:hypothetical protein